MVVDFSARLPNIGNHLRDWGAPLLSLAAMMWVGAAAMLNGSMAIRATMLPSNSSGTAAQVS